MLNISGFSSLKKITETFPFINLGNFERFQELIKTPDFNVNMADDKGRTAIHYAAETGNMPVLSMKETITKNIILL